MPIRTEFKFTLPRGYVDADGRVHTKGMMRPATAMDEIAPLRDPRVQANGQFLVKRSRSKMAISGAQIKNGVRQGDLLIKTIFNSPQKPPKIRQA